MTTQRRSRGHRDSGARGRLVEATRVCLRRHGAAGSSSRLIAEAAGENLGAITYYFGSKHDLIAVALADEVREWVEPALALLAEPGDPAARLLGAVTVLTATFDEHHDRIPGLLEAFVHAARDEDAGGPLAALWLDVQAKLGAVIAELQAVAAVPAWVEPASMAALIVAVAAGTVVSETAAPGGVGHRQIASQFALLLVSTRADG